MKNPHGFGSLVSQKKLSFAPGSAQRYSFDFDIGITVKSHVLLYADALSR